MPRLPQRMDFLAKRTASSSGRHQFRSRDFQCPDLMTGSRRRERAHFRGQLQGVGSARLRSQLHRTLPKDRLMEPKTVRSPRRRPEVESTMAALRQLLFPSESARLRRSKSEVELMAQRQTKMRSNLARIVWGWRLALAAWTRHPLHHPLAHPARRAGPIRSVAGQQGALAAVLLPEKCTAKRQTRALRSSGSCSTSFQIDKRVDRVLLMTERNSEQCTSRPPGAEANERTDRGQRFTKQRRRLPHQR